MASAKRTPTTRQVAAGPAGATEPRILSEAAALLVSFEGPDLVEDVCKVLAVSYGNGDEHYLGSCLYKLRAALDDCLQWPTEAPFKRVLGGRPSGRL